MTEAEEEAVKTPPEIEQEQEASPEEERPQSMQLTEDEDNRKEKDEMERQLDDKEVELDNPKAPDKKKSNKKAIGAKRMASPKPKRSNAKYVVPKLNVVSQNSE
jgi:hypothetical protein